MKLIVTNCRECPFFSKSLASILSKKYGVCGCPKESGPMHLVELGGRSPDDLKARAYLEGRKPIPIDAMPGPPAWCPLRAEVVTVTLGS